MPFDSVSKKSRAIDRSKQSYFSNRKMPASMLKPGIFLFLFMLLSTTTLLADATVNGLTGTMLVPGLEILPPGGARAAVHLTGVSDFDEASFKGVFAFSDDSEVAVVKKFSINGPTDQTDPVFAGKYRVRPNMAVAAIVDPNEGYKDSVMLLSGLPGNRVVLGLGTNIAMGEKEKKARYGRYNENGTEVDPVFFIMGASLNIDSDTKLTIDYAGNDFCVGLRHAFDEALTFDFGFYTPDRIHTNSRYVVGANFGF
ncbi:MAG: hypothetical protein PWR01_2934 [Clostridiales bacterium]|jgi:hypothetical protein|nr:hypothetical protein [Clostridiales bacterium]MDN5281861.1 hypothetical protein [Candidatus Ozemobacter sp.]